MSKPQSITVEELINELSNYPKSMEVYLVVKNGEDPYYSYTTPLGVQSFALANHPKNKYRAVVAIYNGTSSHDKMEDLSEYNM